MAKASSSDDFFFDPGALRSFNLRFFRERWHDGMFDLLVEPASAFPEHPGAYVLGASDGTKFIYPWGASPVFYIGKADVLARRLADHKKYTQQCYQDHAGSRWWPRYQYGAAFGAQGAFYLANAEPSAAQLEARLINAFYESYGAIPVGNSAWPSVPSDKPIAPAPVEGTDQP